MHLSELKLIHVSELIKMGEALEIEVRNQRPQPDDLLFHVLVPAAHWWDDIVFT